AAAARPGAVQRCVRSRRPRTRRAVPACGRGAGAPATAAASASRAGRTGTRASSLPAPWEEPQPVAAHNEDQERDGAKVTEQYPVVAEDLARVELLEEHIVPLADVEYAGIGEIECHFRDDVIAEAHL